MKDAEMDGIAEPPETEAEMEEVLSNLFGALTYASVDGDGELSVSDAEEAMAGLAGCRVQTFEEAMILTSNRGLVLRTRNGRTFQIQVVNG